MTQSDSQEKGKHATWIFVQCCVQYIFFLHSFCFHLFRCVPFPYSFFILFLFLFFSIGVYVAVDVWQRFCLVSKRLRAWRWVKRDFVVVVIVAALFLVFCSFVRRLSHSIGDKKNWLNKYCMYDFYLSDS